MSYKMDSENAKSSQLTLLYHPFPFLSHFHRIIVCLLQFYHMHWKGLESRGELLIASGEGEAIKTCSTFAALVSRRPYKEPFSLEKSLMIIREGRGSHFDPDVVDAFFSCIYEIIVVKEKYKDTSESYLFKVALGA